VRAAAGQETAMNVHRSSAAVLAALAFAGLAATGPAAAQPAPDVWVKHISAPAAPARFTAGQSFTVTLTVENRGTALAPGSAHQGYMVDLSLGMRPAGFPARPHNVPVPYRFVEGMLLKGGRISNTDDLAPGAAHEYSAQVELPRDVKPGKYWLGITADPFNRVTEPQPYPRGENDNVTNVEVEIIPPR
jgi:hypothetical protein